MEDTMHQVPADNPCTHARLANWPTVQPIN